MNTYEICNDQKFLQPIICREPSWELFEEALRKESALFSYPLDIFQQRFKSGNMYLVVEEDTIVATVNLVSKLTKNIRDALSFEDEIYEIGASWIHHKYRGKNLYSQLRNLALQKLCAKDICFSQTMGCGVSKINIRNGWDIMDWSLFPYSSSFVGWKDKQFFMSSGLVVPARKLYNSDCIDEGHDWEKFHHLWCSDRCKVRELDVKIQKHFPQISMWRSFLKNELCFNSLN